MPNNITKEEFISLIEKNKGLIYKVCHLYGQTLENKKLLRDKGFAVKPIRMELIVY